MNSIHSLDNLENEVLARIARYRAAQDDSGTLPAGVTLAALALSIGMAVGWNQAQRAVPAGGSESIVLADDVRLAPSSRFSAHP